MARKTQNRHHHHHHPLTPPPKKNSSILGNVKGQKPYFPPPAKPPSPGNAPNQHKDALAAAEAVASGVLVKAKEVMRHPTFQKVGGTVWVGVGSFESKRGRGFLAYYLPSVHHPSSPHMARWVAWLSSRI